MQTTQNIEGYEVTVIKVPTGALPRYPRQGRIGFCGYRGGVNNELRCDQILAGDEILTPTYQATHPNSDLKCTILDALSIAEAQSYFECIKFVFADDEQRVGFLVLV